MREELKNKSYKFETDTDTEVILAGYAEWGEKILNKLNGMWAFAIYDLKLNQLFLSRDKWFVDFYGNFVKETINNSDFANVLSFCNVKNLRELLIKEENNYAVIKNAYRFCQAYYLKKFFNKPNSYRYGRN